MEEKIKKDEKASFGFTIVLSKKIMIFDLSKKHSSRLNQSLPLSLPLPVYVVDSALDVTTPIVGTVFSFTPSPLNADDYATILSEIVPQFFQC